MKNKIKKFLIFILAFAVFVIIMSNAITVGFDESEFLEDIKEVVETVPIPQDEKVNIKLSFVGDMMLASYKNEYEVGNFRYHSENKPPEYFLSEVVHIFNEDDFTIGNLENVLTDKNLSSVPKNHSPAYWYRAQTSNTDILTSSSVECVSLENNHCNDYGVQGFNDTVEAVKKANLYYGTETEIMYLEKEGFKISVICCGLWGEWQADQVVKRIKEAEVNSDYQIIYFHGGTERLHKPEEWKVRACHKFVDNGADLVIGGHPHVLQPREVYNGIEIVYSLGNFCYGGNRYPENRTIIYQANLDINKTKGTIEFTSNIIPCYVYTGDRNYYQPDTIEDKKEKEKVLNFMEGKEELPY